MPHINNVNIPGNNFGKHKQHYIKQWSIPNKNNLVKKISLSALNSIAICNNCAIRPQLDNSAVIL